VPEDRARRAPSTAKRLPISFFEIDEAHDLTSGDMELRPNIAQLSLSANLFPDRPSPPHRRATRRVRHDIIEQSSSRRDPTSTLASFRRPNLR